MKRSIIFVVLLLLMLGQTSMIKAQDCEIPMGVGLVNQSNEIPQTAVTHLLNKMNHLVANQGVSVLSASDIFLCGRMDIVDKHIIAGAPPKHSYDLTFTFYVANNHDKQVYSSAMLDVKAIGSNETKAIIDGIRRINANHPDLKKLLADAKKKIIAYYDANYRSILTKANTAVKMKQYNDAFEMLLSIPTCCSGYETAMDNAIALYKDYVDEVGKRNLAAARSAWLANPSVDGAAEAAKYLQEIHPDASCYKDAEKLHQEIKAKHEKDYQFEMKKYSDQVSLEEKRINMVKEIGVAFGKGPKESDRDKEPLKIYWIK